MRGKLSREVERQKRARDKRLRGAYQDTISLLSSLSLSCSSASFFLFAFPLSLLPSHKRRLLYFLRLCHPLHPALCAAFTRRAKLCATSLTFDNRCSFGNYSPARSRRQFASPLYVFALFPQTTPAPSSFCPPGGPPNVIYRRPKSLRRKVLTPVSRRFYFSFRLRCVAAGLQVLVQFSPGFRRAESLKPTGVHFELQHPALSKTALFRKSFFSSHTAD